MSRTILKFGRWVEPLWKRARAAYPEEELRREALAKN